MTSIRKKLLTVVFLATLTGLLLSLSGSALAAAAPGDALWAKSAITALSNSTFVGVSTDSSGNIYAVGYIESSNGFDFNDSGDDGKVTSGWAGRNAVIVKYNSDGVARWARSIASATSNSSFVGVSTDSSGNIYAVGYIQNGAQFDFNSSGDEGKVTGGWAGGNNTVIVKYNSDGVAQWARSTVTAVSSSEFSAVSVDASGNIYAVGQINGNAQFDFGGTSTVTGGNGGGNAIIVKYNSGGVAQWARSTVTATDEAKFSGVSADSSGNIYAVGNIDGNAQFDFNSIGDDGKITGGSSASNTVVVRYNSDGVAQWARSTVTAPSYSYFFDVSVDSTGNIYVAGYIAGNAIFDFNSIGDDGKVAGGSTSGNAVVVRYNSDGVAQWAKSTVTAPNNSFYNSVSVDSSGNIYAVGYIAGNAQFDFNESGNDGKVTGGYTSGNTVIVKYNEDGVAQLASSTMTAPSRSEFSGVSVDSSGNIYAVGYIAGNTIFDFNSIGDDGKVAGGYDDGEGFGDNAVIVKYAGELAVPVIPELPFTGGQPAPLASIGQLHWVLPAGTVGFALVFLGAALLRRRARI